MAETVELVQPPNPADDSQLIDANRLWRIIDISPATGWRWKAAKRLPRPIVFGNGTKSTLRWRLSEVRAWIGAGCPRQAEWEAMKATTKR